MNTDESVRFGEFVICEICYLILLVPYCNSVLVKIVNDLEDLVIISLILFGIKQDFKSA